MTVSLSIVSRHVVARFCKPYQVESLPMFAPLSSRRFDDIPGAIHFFLVLKGHLTIEMRDRSVLLGPGELFVVPKGVEHRPVAEDEVHFVLIEPPSTARTGTTVL